MCRVRRCHSQAAGVRRVAVLTLSVPWGTSSRVKTDNKWRSELLYPLAAAWSVEKSILFGGTARTQPHPYWALFCDGEQEDWEDWSSKLSLLFWRMQLFPACLLWWWLLLALIFWSQRSMCPPTDRADASVGEPDCVPAYFECCSLHIY